MKRGRDLILLAKQAQPFCEECFKGNYQGNAQQLARRVEEKSLLLTYLGITKEEVRSWVIKEVKQLIESGQGKEGPGNYIREAYDLIQEFNLSFTEVGKKIDDLVALNQGIKVA